jgi:hypothetical protein
VTAIEPMRKRQIRLPVGLLLSIGAEKPERGPGRPLDHFRAKEGQEGQYAAEAARFREVYGEEPREIHDLFFLQNSVPEVLDIRLLAFSQTGIRGVGDTNFAEITDDDEFERRVFGAEAFTDGFTFFPRDVNEVRPELRESWEGEPIYDQLRGRSDPRVERLQIKVVASLEFCLPEVMGLGKVARISTSGRASIRNLWKALWTEWLAFNGNLSGPMFRLALRPRTTQRFDEKEKAYKQTTIYELVIDTPHTVSELRAAIEQHRRAFGAPLRERLRIEGRALSQALALPSPQGEEQVREEPEAEIPDWLLNKIASLERDLPPDAVRVMLLGVFGVERAQDLSPEQAERYWRMLEASFPSEEVEGEVVENGESSAGETAEASGGTATAAGDLAPADQDSGAEPGPTSTRQAEDSAWEAPQPSAPEELPGEPPVSELMDPVDVAGALVVPKGTRRGATLVSLSEERDWFRYCLQHPELWAAEETFYAGLELFVRHRLPDVWKEVRGR